MKSCLMFEHKFTLLLSIRYLTICSLCFIVSGFLSGCMISIPDHNLKPLPDINAAIAKKEILEFNSRILQKANIFNLITFGFKGSNMQALGMTDLDAQNKTFAVAALTPTGLTLFKIKMVKGKVVDSFVIPEFGGTDLKKAAQTISRDIANIYFNRSADLVSQSVEIGSHEVSIKKDNLLYKFGGSPLKLIQKIKYAGKKRVWSVDYYDYISTGKKEIAHKIFLKNYEYGYFLDIETKKIK